MTKLFISTILLFILALPLALAVDLIPGRVYIIKASNKYFGCLEKSDYESAEYYRATDNRTAFNGLFNNEKCLLFKAGTEVVLFDFQSWRLVEVNPIGTLKTYWTDPKALKPK